MRFSCLTRQGRWNRHARDAVNRQIRLAEMKPRPLGDRKRKRHASEASEAPRKGRAMSRVYNVLTGAPRPSGISTIETPEEEVWVSAEETPFVEIGGPT